MSHDDELTNIPDGTYADPKYVIGESHLEERETVLKGWEALDLLRNEEGKYNEARNLLRNAIAARSKEIFEKMNETAAAVEEEVGAGLLAEIDDLGSLRSVAYKEDWNNHDALDYAQSRIKELEEEGVLEPEEPLSGSSVSDVESEYVSTVNIWENMTEYLEEL